MSEQKLKVKVEYNHTNVDSFIKNNGFEELEGLVTCYKHLDRNYVWDNDGLAHREIKLLCSFYNFSKNLVDEYKKVNGVEIEVKNAKNEKWNNKKVKKLSCYMLEYYLINKTDKKDFSDNYENEDVEREGRGRYITYEWILPEDILNIAETEIDFNSF